MRPHESLALMMHIAAEKHQFQFDLQGRPYFLHCIRVMQNVPYNDDELKAIAIGHDLIEDTDVTAIYLRNMGFSERVVSAIECLTKTKNMTYDAYLNMVMSNRDACIVKLCDLQDNTDIRRMRGTSPKDLARLSKYYSAYEMIRDHLEDM